MEDKEELLKSIGGELFEYGAKPWQLDAASKEFYSKFIEPLQQQNAQLQAQVEKQAQYIIELEQKVINLKAKTYTDNK